jgi:hypothetical protein
MKLVLLAAIPFVLSSCFVTEAGYKGTRSFPTPEVTTLAVDIDYQKQLSKGSAWGTTILGIIRLRPESYASSGGETAATEVGTASLFSWLSGVSLLSWLGGESDSIENAAVYNCLASAKADVLGYPLVRRRLSNYFLWTTEEVWVKGFPGKVVSARSKR